MKHIHTLPPILLIGLLLTLSSLPTVQAATDCAVGIGTIPSKPLKRGAISTTLCHSLTITKTGSGTLTLQTSNLTIKCGGTTCKSNYAINSTVTLTATSTNGSIFMGWGGDCMGTTANATVIMDAAKTCTANFLPLCNTVTQIPQTQCDTLVALYNNTGGASWTDKTGWTQTNTPCSWKGITCSGGNVTNISLASNNLKGALPTLSALTGLRNLVLYTNQLTGTIPDLSKLTSLQMIYLSVNQLTGTIPDLSKLTSLRYLHLDSNQLTGTIPDLSKLTSLQRLVLGNNQLTGPIPSLNTLTKLITLQLSSNPQLCRNPNANYGTRIEVGSFPICGSTLVLTITKTGTGTGEVKTADTRINCGTTCQSGFLATSTVTLVATPASDSTFVSWSGACTGTTANTTAIMNAAKSCTATFDKKPLTLTITKTGTGEVRTTDTKINCGTTCQSSFSVNSTATLIAISSTGSTFTGWTGNCTGTDTSITLTMNAAKACTANFITLSSDTAKSCPTTTTTVADNKIIQPVTLTLTKDGTGTGEVKTADAKLNCGPTCQSDFSANTAVTLIAISAAGSTFTGWSGDCTGTDTSITLTLDMAKTCVANFATVPTDTVKVENCPIVNPVVTLPVTLTLTKTGTGTVEVKTADTTLNCNPTCQADYTQNSTVTLTATPATGFTFTGWGGGCTGTNPEITVTMDTAKICLAHFDQPTSTPTPEETTTAPANGTEDTFCNPVLEIPKVQCQTLVTLYDHTNGPNWTHRDGWRTTPTPCTWYGITCTNNNVTAINLTGNNLLGAFPDLTLLTQLQSLQLSNNLLQGTMPTYLKDLTQLRTLELDHNPDLCRDHNLDYGSLTGLYAVSQCLTHPLPIAAFKASTLTGPAPLPVTLDATVSTVEGSISNYQWETSDGQPLTGATPSLTYNQSGTYTITLKVTDNQGATSTNVAKQTITVTSTQPTLIVRKTGNGRGKIKAIVDNNETMNCQSTCSESRLDYPVGTTVKLTANPLEGAIFKGWNGDCGGTATPMNVTMDSNKTCIADFELDNTAQNRYTFTVQAIGTGQGTVEAAGINCGEDCTDNYKPGKPLWLKAVPEIDSIFGGWSSDCADQTKQSIELVMNSNKTCQVTFNSRDITMSYLGVNNLIENAELDTGEEIYDRYPRYPFNDDRLQEALWLAEPVLALVDRQINWADLNSSWPRQLNGIDQGLKGAYTESVKVMEDAEIQGFIARATVLGKYVEVRVKLLNDVGITEVLPILVYYGEPPTIAQATGTLAPTTVTYHLVRSDRVIAIGSGLSQRCGRPRC